MPHMKLFALVFVITGLVVTPSAWAQGEGIVCAAVVACDGNGGVLQEFRGGPCEAVYQTQCTSELANTLGEQVQSCESSKRTLSKNLNTLTKKNRNLQRQIRKLQKRIS